MKIVVFALLSTFAVTVTIAGNNSTSLLEGKLIISKYDAAIYSNMNDPEKKALALLKDKYGICIGSGVAMSPHQIIAAADSVKDYIGKKNYGNMSVTVNGEISLISKIIMPENNDNEHDFDYTDLALIVTHYLFKSYLTDNHIPKHYMEYAMLNDETLLVGWQNYNLPLNVNFQLKVIGRGVTCTNNLSEVDTIKIFCAKLISNSRTLTMEKLDSGAPLFKEGKLVGFVSQRHCPLKTGNIIFTCPYGNGEFISKSLTKSALPTTH